MMVQEAKSQRTAKLPVGIGGAVDILLRADRRDIVAILTGVVLLLVSHTWFFAVLSTVCLFVIIFSESTRRNPWFWLAIVTVWIPTLCLHWIRHEDHIFLAVYWTAAFGLSLWKDDWSKVLAVNARLLIGLAFAFAVLWKVTSVEFCDGSLMHYKLLFDFRFREAITEPVNAVTAAQTYDNLESLRSLRRRGSLLTEVPVSYERRLSIIAFLMTWWTIVIEAALGILFLIPGKKMFATLRNASMLIFAFTTYLIVPVLGFGNLFMVMGFAQCDESERRTKLAYVATSVLLLAAFSLREFGRNLL